MTARDFQCERKQFDAHVVCDDCWSDIKPGYPNPARLTDAVVERCCRCSKDTRSGIYYRTAEPDWECLQGDPGAAK